MSGIQGLDSPLLQPANDIKSAASSAAQQGAFQGVGVALASSTASLVQNALEELTFSLSEKTEKDLSKRKIRDAMSDAQLQAEKLKELMAIAFKIEKRDHLDELINDLLSGRHGSAQALNEQLNEFSGDASEQYLALMEIRRQLTQSEGNEAILQLVNQRLSVLESTDKNRILAGLNSFIPAHEAAQAGLGDLSDLRGFYQDSVLDYQGLTGVWHTMAEQYGESRLELATSFMLKALAADYEAAGSSIEKSQLVSIMADMNRIKMLSGVYDSCALIAEIIMPKKNT